MRKIIIFILICVLSINVAIATAITNELTFIQKAIQSPLVWLLIIASIFWLGKYEKEKGSIYFRIFGFTILIGFVIAFYTVSLIQVPSLGYKTDWLTNYKEKVPEEYATYTLENDFYDFSNDSIQMIINNIKSIAKNEIEAVQMALDFVYSRIEYDPNEPTSACLKLTSSSVIEKGTAQCEGKSILLISILRGLGMAARPVGGCLSTSPECDVKMTLFSISGFGIKKPIWNEIGEIDPNQKYFDRGASKPGLHAWVMYYSIEFGEVWVFLEPTSGEIVRRDGCYRYDTELVIGDDDREHLCYSDDVSFIKWCKNLGSG